MHRAMWTVWGLLVVVVDLPLGRTGWDLAPDLVGLAWVVYGTWGFRGLPWLVVRVACLVGALAYPVRGTSLFRGEEFALLQLTGATLEALVWTALVTQLSTGVLTLPGVDVANRRWATRTRFMGGVVGAALLVSLPVTVWTGIPIYVLMVIASVVVGLLTAVMLSRVARAGELVPAGA